LDSFFCTPRVLLSCHSLSLLWASNIIVPLYCHLNSAAGDLSWNPHPSPGLEEMEGTQHILLQTWGLEAAGVSWPPAVLQVIHCTREFSAGEIEAGNPACMPVRPSQRELLLFPTFP
jgi:hypothetical protein